MRKIFIICILFSLIKGESSAQKYIHMSFVTYNQDHLFPNMIILYNKNDYKLTRADTLSFLQVFEVKKTDFMSVAAFVSNTLLKIKKEPTDKTEKIEECYFIEIMYDASKSDDFFLPRNACRKFFSEYEEIIKSAKMGRKLGIAIKLCGIECK